MRTNKNKKRERSETISREIIIYGYEKKKKYNGLCTSKDYNIISTYSRKRICTYIVEPLYNDILYKNNLYEVLNF